MSGVFSMASHCGLQYFPEVTVHEHTGCAHFCPVESVIWFSSSRCCSESLRRIPQGSTLPPLEGRRPTRSFLYFESGGRAGAKSADPVGQFAARFGFALAEALASPFTGTVAVTLVPAAPEATLISPPVRAALAHAGDSDAGADRTGIAGGARSLPVVGDDEPSRRRPSPQNQSARQCFRRGDARW